MAPHDDQATDVRVSVAMRRLGVATIALFGFVTACQALLDFGASDGGNAPDGAADSALPDAVPLADASFDSPGADATDVDAARDAGCMNLILNPGFESTASCDPWVNYGGTLLLGTPANSGTHACLACANVGGINLVATIPNETFAPGETLHFELSARAADPLLYARQIRLLGYGNDDFTPNDFQLSDVYQRMRVDHVFTVDAGDAQAAKVQVFVLDIDAGPDAAACILFDDVSACVTH